VPAARLQQHLLPGSGSQAPTVRWLPAAAARLGCAEMCSRQPCSAAAAVRQQVTPYSRASRCCERPVADQDLVLPVAVVPAAAMRF
jgi:hypothetical protein